MYNDFQNGGVPFRNAPAYHPRQQSAGYYPQQKPQYKKSGAKYSKITKGNFVGEIIVNAWNASKRKGLITCTVAPYRNSKTYIAETSGKKYVTMIAVVKFENSGVEKLIPCSMNVETKVIVLKELSMVITPNGRGTTRTGKSVSGYFGTNIRK